MNVWFIFIGFAFGSVLALLFSYKYYKAGDLEIIEYENDLTMRLILEREVPIMRAKKFVVLRVKNSIYYEN